MSRFLPFGITAEQELQEFDERLDGFRERHRESVLAKNKVINDLENELRKLKNPTPYLFLMNFNKKDIEYLLHLLNQNQEAEYGACKLNLMAQFGTINKLGI